MRPFWLSALQREEPVDATGRTRADCHQAAVGHYDWRCHERPLLVVKLS